MSGTSETQPGGGLFAKRSIECLTRTSTKGAALGKAALFSSLGSEKEKRCKHLNEEIHQACPSTTCVFDQVTSCTNR